MTLARRAPLFVPGDSQRKIAKSLTLNADAIILELEDGVAYSQKAVARQTVAQALQTLDFGRSERLVRINALDTGLAEADIDVTIQGHPDGYVIPKVSSARTITWVSQRLLRWERENGWLEGSTRLFAIIETAIGVMNLREIAAADPRMMGLMFGAEDLASDIGAVRTTEGWESFYARSAVVTTAAAYGLEAIDTPYVTLGDTAGLLTDAQRALEMGYSGKLAIHPGQLEPLHQLFTPSDEAVAAAQALITAYEAHQVQGSGVFVYQGKMVDMPMIRSAHKILKKVEDIHVK